MNELALFAGAGGGILGGILAGWNTICAVERDAYCASVLLQRQTDGCLPIFPIWSDVCSFDGKPWCGLVDVVSGGFPCQDISAAGKGAGIEGERSGLWREMARIIGEVRPRFVQVENSPLLVNRGLAVVISDLASMGYDAEWFCISAQDLEAPHKRDRIWILAHTNSYGRKREDLLLSTGDEGKRNAKPARDSQVAPYTNGNGLEGAVYMGDCAQKDRKEGASASRRIKSSVWKTHNPEPGVCRVDDGMAHWLERIKALGNGQVPCVAATAWITGTTTQ